MWVICRDANENQKVPKAGTKLLIKYHTLPNIAFLSLFSSRPDLFIIDFMQFNTLNIARKIKYPHT